MPKLLVSVRNVAEARLALAAAVDLIDIKEPSAGALGAASAATIDEIVRLVDRRCPTSVACGELIQSATDLVRGLAELNPRDSRGWPNYVKVGLAGCGSIADWPQRWRQLLEMLPAATVPVAVIYADWRAADAPRPAAVIEQAKAVQRAAILIDTFDKAGPGVLRLLSIDTLGALIEQARGLVPIVVAGQLTLDDAAAVARLGPDYLGVRGGVCRPDRTGDLDRQRLTEWRRMIAGNA
jgi:uncharacterized protein (UPF0264 family)